MLYLISTRRILAGSTDILCLSDIRYSESIFCYIAIRYNLGYNLRLLSKIIFIIFLMILFLFSLHIQHTSTELFVSTVHTLTNSDFLHCQSTFNEPRDRRHYQATSYLSGEQWM